MTESTSPSFDDIRAKIAALRDADPRTPTAVQLGPSEQATIKAYVQQITGQTDAGPIVSFQSMAVVEGADGVSLTYAEDIAPAPATETPAEAPANPPAEAPPSAP